MAETSKGYAEMLRGWYDKALAYHKNRIATQDWDIGISKAYIALAAKCTPTHEALVRGVGLDTELSCPPYGQAKHELLGVWNPGLAGEIIRNEVRWGTVKSTAARLAPEYLATVNAKALMSMRETYLAVKSEICGELYSLDEQIKESPNRITIINALAEIWETRSTGIQSRKAYDKAAKTMRDAITDTLLACNPGLEDTYTMSGALADVCNKHSVTYPTSKIQLIERGKAAHICMGRPEYAEKHFAPIETIGKIKPVCSTFSEFFLPDAPLAEGQKATRIFLFPDFQTEITIRSTAENNTITLKNLQSTGYANADLTDDQKKTLSKFKKDLKSLLQTEGLNALALANS